MFSPFFPQSQFFFVSFSCLSTHNCSVLWLQSGTNVEPINQVSGDVGKTLQKLLFSWITFTNHFLRGLLQHESLSSPPPPLHAWYRSSDSLSLYIYVYHMTLIFVTRGNGGLKSKIKSKLNSIVTEIILDGESFRSPSYKVQSDRLNKTTWENWQSVSTSERL